MPGVGDACREKSMADIPKDTRMRSITGARHGSLQPTLCVPTSAQHSCVPQHCLAHHISPPTQAHLSLAATSGHLVLEKMNPTVSIAVILTGKALRGEMGGLLGCPQRSPFPFLLACPSAAGCALPDDPGPERLPAGPEPARGLPL